MECDICQSEDGRRIDEETVLCEQCREEIKTHIDRVETEQDAIRGMY
jgi:hypothetical protein